MKTFSLTLALLLMPMFCMAEPGSKTRGEHTVYYTVFPSSFLQPEIARLYGITRSNKLAILNVSVRMATESGSVEHPAEVSGTESDLIYKTPLEFREIREKGAIYYLAEISTKHTEMRYFDLKVIPEGASESIDIKWQQKVHNGE